MSKVEEIISAIKSNLNKMEKVRNEHPIFEKGILHVMAVEQEKLEIFQEIQAEQEEQNKPVEVPQFIINTMKNYDSLQGMLTEEYYSNSTEEIDDDNVQSWIDDNFDLLCRAWLTGNYTVKQEPKYQILKLHVDYFDAVAKGIKTFEIRKNDRNYQIGNVLVLREYDPIDSRTGEFTGRECRVRVVCMTDYKQKHGYVVLGIVLVKEGTQ